MNEAIEFARMLLSMDAEQIETLRRYMKEAERRDR